MEFNTIEILKYVKERSKQLKQNYDEMKKVSDEESPLSLMLEGAIREVESLRYMIEFGDIQKKKKE